MIGSARTGKSCLLHQFIENKFKQGSEHTAGQEFAPRGGQRGWGDCDAPGLGHSRPGGALWVSDMELLLTGGWSPAWVPAWVQLAGRLASGGRTLASPHIVACLCGFKKDLDPERKLTFLEASRFAQENELMFLAISVLTGKRLS